MDERFFVFFCITGLLFFGVKPVFLITTNFHDNSKITKKALGNITYKEGGGGERDICLPTNLSDSSISAVLIYFPRGFITKTLTEELKISVFFLYPLIVHK